MSHATVMVLGPKNEGELEAILAPFSEEIQVEPYFDPSGQYVLDKMEKGESLEDFAKRIGKEWEQEFVIKDGVLGEMSTYNPESKWDWWVVGGRWRGSLPLKDGATSGQTGDLSWVHEGRDDRMYPGGVDVAQLGDVDFTLKRTQAMEQAGDRWDAAEEARKGIALPELPPEGSDRDAYQAWWQTPTVSRIKEVVGGWGMLPEDIVEMLADRDHYVVRCGNDALTCFATVTPEGEWIEPGRMGWFGMSTDSAGSRDSYSSQVDELLTTLPDETMVWVVDYHI